MFALCLNVLLLSTWLKEWTLVFIILLFRSQTGCNHLWDQLMSKCTYAAYRMTWHSGFIVPVERFSCLFDITFMAAWMNMRTAQISLCFPDVTCWQFLHYVCLELKCERWWWRNVNQMTRFQSVTPSCDSHRWFLFSFPSFRWHNAISICTPRLQFGKHFSQDRLTNM